MIDLKSIKTQSCSKTFSLIKKVKYKKALSLYFTSLPFFILEQHNNNGYIYIYTSDYI
jgi:hypothetical protein